MSSVAALRALIEQRFPGATPVVHRTSRPVATGIAPLDRALPHGGFPLAMLSVCEPTGGVTAMLRSASETTIAAGDRAAWIDGARTIAGAFWTDGPLLVRPESPMHGVRAADELLRSGGFRLVVLTGVAPSDTETMRLVRAAHEGGGAVVTISPTSHMAALRLSSTITEFRWCFDPFGEPAEVQEAHLRVHVRALGWDKRADFFVPVRSHDLRLSLEPGLADRRGLLRSQLVRAR
ncbi:MAG TPA: hypothetical protein VJR92_15150 [Gemmatimonadaceae bacterium]|nr:hypothetical protein [Gemmatimonadaceae bacterium]